ncbi:hypothetical protein [Streptomyces sp. SCL15-6]|jgi:hypothetical protein|uniref:hypothetical protein n=1 Tax=Streptomyces sp. SCL15-6 TaxID=2967222 RepID=UPI002966C203|nr:hypothetical protein [Streptomyces sp. SCL15-6]
MPTAMAHRPYPAAAKAWRQIMCCYRPRAEAGGGTGGPRWAGARWRAYSGTGLLVGTAAGSEGPPLGWGGRLLSAEYAPGAQLGNVGEMDAGQGVDEVGLAARMVWGGLG